MTNGEKIKEIFPDTKIITQYDNPFGDRFMVFTLNNEDMQVNIDWWNAEYKEPTTKNDLEVDAVSRKAVINQIFYSTDNNGDVVLGSALRERIEKLPSVTPIRPKGHWIDGYCSECGCDVPAYIVDWKWQKDMDAKYCPNCGCRMVEPQESEGT